MPDHRTGQVTYMREAGYLFKTQAVRHEDAQQATAGYSSQETLEKGGVCSKQTMEQPEGAAQVSLKHLLSE